VGSHLKGAFRSAVVLVPPDKEIRIFRGSSQTRLRTPATAARTRIHPKTIEAAVITSGLSFSLPRHLIPVTVLSVKITRTAGQRKRQGLRSNAQRGEWRSLLCTTSRLAVPGVHEVALLFRRRLSVSGHHFSRIRRFAAAQLAASLRLYLA
jgi:hypothetical protein